MLLAFLFISLFIMLTIGVPVGFAIGGATIASMLLYTNLDVSMIANYCISGIDSFTMMAIPFFILSGTVMSVGGLARRLIDVAACLVGWITGGLGAVVALSSMFFGAISGSSMATVSSIGSIMVPQMVNKGYDKGYAAVYTACAGTVGAVIPPSIPFVVYGVATSTSVGDLFMAGIFPGILIGIGMIIGNVIICKKNGYTAKMEKPTFKQAMKCIWDAKWALLSPVIILGGIYSGVFTPTEASVVAVMYSAVVALLIYREITIRQLYDAIVRTAVVNGITTFLLGLSTGFAALLSLQRVPSQLCDWMVNLTDSKFLFLLIVNIVLLIIGCFMDNIPATIVMGPMLLPAMEAFGVNAVSFGVLMSVNLLAGLVTPPYGCSLFVASAICQVSMKDMLKHIGVPLTILIICVMIITYVPWFTTWFM